MFARRLLFLDPCVDTARELVANFLFYHAAKNAERLTANVLLRLRSAALAQARSTERKVRTPDNTPTLVPPPVMNSETRHPDHPAPTSATTSIEISTSSVISAVNTVEHAVPTSAGFSWEQFCAVCDMPRFVGCVCFPRAYWVARCASLSCFQGLQVHNVVFGHKLIEYCVSCDNPRHFGCLCFPKMFSIRHEILGIFITSIPALSSRPPDRTSPFDFTPNPPYIIHDREAYYILPTVFEHLISRDGSAALLAHSACSGGL